MFPVSSNSIRLPRALTPRLRWKENFLDESASVQKAVGYELLRRQESECKAAGVAALESVVMAGQLLVDDLAPVAAIFDEGRAHLLSISTTVLRQIRSIKDWGTADSLSTRVLRRLVQRDVTAANVLISWRNAKNQWRVRAGLVSFVVLAKHGDKNYPNFISSLLPPIEAGLKWEERFVQLAAGWLLRELYLADSKRIVAFIELHIHRFSAEGLRYAVEKMKDPLRGRLIDLRRQTLREGKRPADTPLEEEDFADSEAAEKKGKTYMRRSKRRKATIEKDV